MGATSLHFPEKQLACHHGVNGCVQALVDGLEALRLITGPITVNDAFRCPLCNGKLKNAATHSQHMMGTAADIQAPGWTGAQLEAAARKVPAFKGFGRSDHSNYLHVDVRPTPAQWCYDTNGKEIIYYAAVQPPEATNADHRA